MKLTIAALANEVYLCGAGVKLRLTPQLAEQLAAELPRFAAQARILGGTHFDIAEMADVLRSAGFRWEVDDPDAHTGAWTQHGDPVSEIMPFAEATRQVYFTMMVPGPATVQ